jgi:hypothetical protein
MQSVDYNDERLDPPDVRECRNCERLQDQLDAMTGTCTWTEDSIEAFWRSSCGNVTEFIEADKDDLFPYTFCPYCGHKIIEVPA